MSRLIPIARGVLSDYFLWGVTALSNIVLAPLMLRYLGSEGYGLWAIFASMLGYMGLVDLGLGPSTATHVARYHAQGRHQAIGEWVSSVFFLYLPLSGVVLGAALLFGPFVGSLFHVSAGLSQAAKLAFIASGLGLAVALPRGAFRGTLVGHQRMDVANLTDALFVLVSTAFVVVAIVSGGGLPGAAIASAAMAGLQTGVTLLLLRRFFPHVKLDPRLFNWQLVGSALRFGLPILVVFITAQVVFRTDNIVIGVFKGAHAVAPYAIAYTLVWFSLNLVFKISDSLLPVFSGLRAAGEQHALRQTYLESSRLSLALAVCLTTGLLFFGRFAITGWVGAEYFVGTGTLTVLALLPFVHSVTHVGSIMLIGLGRARSIALLSVPDAALNLALSVALVRPLGVMGVALGTLIGELLTTFWYIPLLCNHEAGLSYREFLAHVAIRPILGAGPAALVAWGTSRALATFHPLGAAVVGGMLMAVTYFAIYFMLSSPGERTTYWRAFRGVWFKARATPAEG